MACNTRVRRCGGCWIDGCLRAGQWAFRAVLREHLVLPLLSPLSPLSLLFKARERQRQNGTRTHNYCRSDTHTKHAREQPLVLNPTKRPPRHSARAPQKHHNLYLPSSPPPRPPSHGPAALLPAGGGRRRRRGRPRLGSWRHQRARRARRPSLWQLFQSERQNRPHRRLFHVVLRPQVPGCVVD